MKEKKTAATPTAAPWEQSGTLIYSKEGTICELSELRKSRFIQHEALQIGSEYWDEQMANARLIAAAPDLLEACKSAISLLHKLGGHNHDPEYSELEEAIYKARIGAK
jgi:hypothetical protein